MLTKQTALFSAHLSTRGLQVWCGARASLSCLVLDLVDEVMEAVKEFCKNAGGYSMQKLQGSVRSLQDAVKVGGELTPQAVNALISKLGGFWSKYR